MSLLLLFHGIETTVGKLHVRVYPPTSLTVEARPTTSLTVELEGNP